VVHDKKITLYILNGIIPTYNLPTFSSERSRWCVMTFVIAQTYLSPQCIKYMKQLYTAARRLSLLFTTYSVHRGPRPTHWILIIIFINSIINNTPSCPVKYNNYYLYFPRALYFKQKVFRLIPPSKKIKK